MLCGAVALLWLRGGGAVVLADALSDAGFVPPAQPVIVVAAAVAATTVGWAVLYLLWGPGGWLDRGAEVADARRPLSYADLGPPPPREQPLPTDLDQPLSAYDPEALLPGVRRPT